MSKQKKDSPGAANAEANLNHHRPTLVINNRNPRQLWRGNPPLKRVKISDELLHHLETLKMEVCNGR
jgi:hypothetical protein